MDKVSDLTKAFNTDHFPEISICNYINWDLLNLLSYLIFKIYSKLKLVGYVTPQTGITTMISLSTFNALQASLYPPSAGE